MNLNVIWFVLLFVLLGGYAVLDGFDFGVGVLHLFFRDNEHRKQFIRAIAPVWDGNEVWLLTGGGALFAAFPVVYATVFSGFYIALMLVLACLIFRAVGLEFRGKVNAPRWKQIWDSAFGICSLLLAVLFGVAFGNVLRGVTIGADGYYSGTFFDLLNPYAVLVGVLALSVFTMHGAIYLAGKTADSLQARLIRVGLIFWSATILLFILVTLATNYWAPSLLQSAAHRPLAWALTAALFITAIIIPIKLKSGRPMGAFFASGGLIAVMMGLAAVGLFPRLLPALDNPAASLTIYNSSSTPLTLRVMLIIALIGMPLVITYTILIHRIFHSKIVAVDEY